MDDLGVPLFSETSMCWSLLGMEYSEFTSRTVWKPLMFVSVMWTSTFLLMSADQKVCAEDYGCTLAICEVLFFPLKQFTFNDCGQNPYNRDLNLKC